MNFLKIGLILSAILLFIIACNQPQTGNTNLANNTAVVVNTNSNIQQPPTATDELASARKLYSEQCINCHKENGSGGVSVIEGKKIKAPDFTSERMKNDDENDWIEVIKNGAVEDGMPAYKGKISDDDIKHLVRLIRKDFQGKP
jgi:mono/diheme cytochrome c family protein